MSDDEALVLQNKTLSQLCLWEAKQDIEDLYENFLKMPDLSFLNFATVWKQAKFSQIYSERTNANELIEFTEEIILIASELICRDKIEDVVFGIFLSFSLFSKQLFKRRYVKINIPVENCIKLEECMQKLMAEGYIDAMSILGNLWKMGAIVFTGAARDTGLELGYRKYLKSEQEDDLETQFRKSGRLPFQENLFSHMEYASKLYEVKKREFLGDENVEYFDNNFLDEMKKKLEQFYLNKSDHEESASDIGVKRQRVKHKAYVNGCTNASKSPEDEETTDKTSKRRRKIRLTVLGGKMRQDRSEKDFFDSDSDDNLEL